jgi:hypothetical protein
MSKLPAPNNPADVLAEDIIGRAAAAWALMLYAGVIGVWFNVYHSVTAGGIPPSLRAAIYHAVMAGGIPPSLRADIYHSLTASGMPLDLAVGAGLTPTVITLLLSHLVAQERDRGILRAVAFVVMCCAMALSLRSIGEVVRPAEGFLWWLFGPVTDAAELAALHIVLKRTRERAAQLARIRAAQAALGLAADEAAAAAAAAAAARTGPGQAPGEAPAGMGLDTQGRPPARQPQRQTPPRYDNSDQAEAARRAYRKSVRDGRPLTDRALAKMFPPKSRTWAANRIAEAKASPRLVATGTDDPGGAR